MVFLENVGDPGHSGLSVGLSRKRAELTLEANSNAGNGSHPPRSEMPGPLDPTTSFCDKRIINQLDKSALTSLIGGMGPL